MLDNKVSWHLPPSAPFSSWGSPRGAPRFEVGVDVYRWIGIPWGSRNTMAPRDAPSCLRHKLRVGGEGWNRKRVGHVRDRLFSFLSSFFFIFISLYRPGSTARHDPPHGRESLRGRGLIEESSFSCLCRSTGPTRTFDSSICHDITMNIAPLCTRRCVSLRSEKERERERESQQCHASIRTLSTWTYRIRPDWKFICR